MSESVVISYLLGEGGEEGSPSRLGDQLAILNAEEWVVRERWFLGSVDLQIGGVTWAYKNTPLLDFALALRYAVNILAADGVIEFDAEGGPKVRLQLIGETARVADLRSGLEGECSFVDLVGSAGRFLRSLLDDITRARPDFLLNDVVRMAFRESGARQLNEEAFGRYSRAGQIRGKLLKRQAAQG
ncbi:hypothetical protein [Streptomyces sp. NBC_01408]|uniref:hypothetical protein n=1 Tax=Streptomyces sp. NBC_01408 TaxID=2903855 RepID=UPI0022556F61|nr:hypothetical protein [Streptomyces sp. NBC_01408]MCX4696418.1 hypothetical protein [Streptomyces sp. NBC_01408]